MKLSTQALTLAFLTVAAGAVSAQENIQSNLNASMRLGLEADTEPEAELSFNNYGSRIRWSGVADVGETLAAKGYIELGFDQDDGVNNTRQAWLGVEGDFGEVLGGKQYNAFYDTVSSFVDIAYWQSCFLEVGCVRESSTVKYTSPEAEEGEMRYSGSTRVLNNGDDFVDGIDVGANFSRAGLDLGVGASLVFTDGTGFALGVAAAMPLDGGARVTGTVQLATDDYFGSEDATLIVTGTYAKDQIYALATVLDNDDTGLSLAGGYILPLVADRALIYFEAGVFDPGVDGIDANLFGRGVFIFNFDVLSTSTES